MPYGSYPYGIFPLQHQARRIKLSLDIDIFFVTMNAMKQFLAIGIALQACAIQISGMEQPEILSHSLLKWQNENAPVALVEEIIHPELHCTSAEG